MQLSGLDLNLLVALNALLREVSVTRAANRLNLSQPALSASLARLRRHFDDELLKRVGNRYELTPLAVQLQPLCDVALDSAHRVFTTEPAFSPSTSQREFTVLCSDYAMAVLGGVASTMMNERAPHLRLRLRQHTPDMIARAPEVLRTVDGLVMPHGFLSGLPHADLYEDSWVCLVSRDNTAVGSEMTMELLAQLPWAMMYHAPTAFTPAERQLQMLGVQPKVQIVVESFLSLPFVVAGTDRVAMIQRNLVPGITAGGDVRVLACPFDAVNLVEALWWHPMFDRDRGHIWLRALFVEAGRRISESAGHSTSG